MRVALCVEQEYGVILRDHSVEIIPLHEDGLIATRSMGMTNPGDNMRGAIRFSALRGGAPIYAMQFV